MDPLQLLVASHGIFTRAEAREAGYDDRAVTAAVRSGHWHRVRRGAYTFGDVWRDLDAVGRHRVLCAAVVRSLSSRVALSHVSGAIHHGVDVWGLDLRRVHVTRLDGGPGRIEPDVVHHEGLCLDSEVSRVRGTPVLPPERCVLEAGSRGGGESALVLLDSVLHKRLATRDSLEAMFSTLQHWPFMRRLQVPLRLTGPGGESVGESRGLWLCWSAHLPRPERQFEIRDAKGELVAITDWAWPHLGVLGEFDGRLKYGRSLRPGQTPEDAVYAEKLREDRIREITGMRMVRLCWSDLDQPDATAARIRRLMQRPA